MKTDYLNLIAITILAIAFLSLGYGLHVLSNAILSLHSRINLLEMEMSTTTKNVFGYDLVNPK